MGLDAVGRGFNGFNLGSRAMASADKCTLHNLKFAQKLITRPSNARSFFNWVSLSPWLVTVTSGLAKVACVSFTLFSFHRLTKVVSNSSGALCRTFVVNRLLSAGAGERPDAVASCIESQHSNWVQNRLTYERSTRRSTAQLRYSKLMLGSVSENSRRSDGVRDPWGMHQKSSHTYLTVGQFRKCARIASSWQPEGSGWSCDSQRWLATTISSAYVR
mmetsp:Transcript_12230/g.13803  ORF Transcript_12230/g.13803 Transcript_12230/m.13803 type:complete len:217 (+) Transcript_12230:73-723(+)